MNSTVIYSQNLVLNGGFEDTIDCPTWSAIGIPSLPCINWYQSIGSPDFWSTTYTFGCGCSQFPHPIFGYQLAKSGNNCIGFAGAIYPIGGNGREMPTGILIDTLIKNHKYYTSFFINLANNSNFSISNIGAYFSKDSINPDSNYLFTINAQIMSPDSVLLSDTVGWMIVDGYYLAQGGEKYITIGCLLPDSSISIDSNSFGLISGSYYFLDDISVIDCTAIGLSELPELQVNTWYNAIDKAIKINTTENNLSFTLINAMGKVVMQDNLVQNEISAAALSRGVYMLVVEDKRYRRRVFKVGVY